MLRFPLCILLITGAWSEDWQPPERTGIDAEALAAEPFAAAIGEEPKFLDDLAAWVAANGILDEERRGRFVAARMAEWEERGTTEAPADAVELFADLCDAVPRSLRGPLWAPELIVLATDDRLVEGAGGGRVAVGRGVLARCEGPELAFALATRLAHDVLGHHDRDRVEVLLAELADRRLPDPGLAYHGPTRCRSADLFALQLCAAAGHDPEACLDFLRRLAKAERDGEGRWEDHLARHASPLRRLGALLRMRDGVLVDESHGLHRWDGDGYAKAQAGPLPAGSVLLFHGIESNPDKLATLARAIAATGRPVYAFDLPHDHHLGYLARAVAREMRRFPAEEPPWVVAHSAGGLVTRYWLEHLGGEASGAIFLATPHRGSDMARLHFLAEAKQFVEAVAGEGLLPGLESIVADGREEMAVDLRPGSLFLRHLGDPPEGAAYHVVRGRAVPKAAAIAATLALPKFKELLRDKLVAELDEEPLRRCAERCIERFRLPMELLAGDGAVSLASAGLADARSVHTLELDHARLRNDPQIAELVVGILEGREGK